MRMLVVASAISQAWIALAYDCLDSGPTVVVDFDDAIHAQLKSLGISSIPIRVPGDTSWAQRDTDFAKLALPGSLTEPFPLTDLPMWKVLSLDRLSFWYRGRQAQLEYEAVMGLDWDSALVPLRLHNRDANKGRATCVSWSSLKPQRIAKRASCPSPKCLKPWANSTKN